MYVQIDANIWKVKYCIGALHKTYSITLSGQKETLYYIKYQITQLLNGDSNRVEETLEFELCVQGPVMALWWSSTMDETVGKNKVIGN